MEKIIFKQIEKNAAAYFESGFNCAESVSQAIIEAFAQKDSNYIPKIATAFGGGIGGTREELCGALSGGIIAIGYLSGRTFAGQDYTLAKNVASQYRDEFNRNYGKTNCSELLDQFEPQIDYNKCQELVGRMAGSLAKILVENGQKPK